MSKSPISQIVYTSNECPDIVHYWLLGDSSSVTVKGIFINKSGKQTGVAVSTTVPVGDTVNNPVQLATAIPTDAVGFIGNTSASLRFGLYSTLDTTEATDFKANYAKYPLLEAGNALNFGSVAVV